MSNWKKTIITDLCSLVVDCVNRTAPLVDVETDYKMIRTSNIKNGVIDVENVRYVSADTFKIWNRRATPQVNDVILTREAPHGEVGIIKTNDKIFLGQRLMLYRADETKCDPRFLYYSFLTAYCKEQFDKYASGSTVQHIKVPDAKKFLIPLPTLPVQRRLAEVLGRYDALIDNYQRQISALEAMAQELYREWFVRGRCPYALPSEDGGLPVGWEELSLNKVLELKYGKSLVEENRQSGCFPVVGSSGIVDFHDEALVKRPGIVVGRKGNVGSVFWIDKPFYPIDTAYYVESSTSQYFLFFNLQTQNFISGDAAVPGLNREQALSNKIILPTQDALEHFDRIIKPVFDKITNIQTQITTLRQMRDALLPRLLSGQLYTF